MASIDKIMALSNEIKKKKKLDQTTISMTNINDLAKEIKSGNKNAVNDYLSKSTGINLNKNGGNTNNLKKAQTKKSAINKEQLMNEASSNYPLMFGKKQADEDGKKWYQKILQVPEAFDDGYQFGDVTKTIGGSVVDLGLSAVKGFVSVPEQGADLFTGLLAQGADLIGKDDFADNLRTSIANQEGHIFSKAINKIQEPVDDYSILGETTDVGGEGIGQAFAYYTIGKLGGATKGATLTGKNLTVAEKAAQVAKATKTTRDVAIFSSAAGGTLSESYQKEDVEDWQVWLKAIGTGILAKKIEEAGGIFSKGGADKVATNAMTGDMKSSFAKVATRFLGTGIAEGGEEGIEYVAGKVLDIGIDTANSITSENDATFFDGWDWDEFWTSIFAGTMSGTSMGAGQTTIETVNNKFSNPNMTWGEALDLTDKNQANRDQIEIAENKKAKLENKLKSKNLTQTEIDKIFTEMQQIDEQIKALKGQSNIAPVDNTAQIEGLQTAIEEKTQELERSQDAREKQIIQEQINNLQEELNDATNAQTFTDESNLKQQAFVYEANENDGEFAKGVYESASKLMNNTKEAHTLVDVVAKIAEDRGTAYEFTNNKALKEAGHRVGDNTINGLVTEDGKVLINLDSNKSLTTVLGHETTHLLEGTQEYEALKKVVIEYAQQKGIYKDTYDRISNLYQGTNANIDNEITSDLVGELLFTDQSFVENLSVQQPNVFQKIYNYIKHVYKMATAGSQEAKQLEKIKYQFDQAWKKQGKTIKEGVKYSKGEATDNQGRTLTKEQQEYFKDSKARDENGNLEVVYHGSNKAGFMTFNRNYNFFSNSRDIGESYTRGTETVDTRKDIEPRAYDGGVYEGYVNLTNPLIIDVHGENWSGIPLEYIGIENIEDVFKENGSSYFNEKGKLRASTNDIVEAIAENDSFEYDGIIFKNVIDRGMYFHKAIDNHTSNVYVTFNSNQFKALDNTNPTSNPDIRYSLTPDYGMQHRPSTDYGDASNFEENMPDVFEHPEWYMFGGDGWYKKAYNESLTALRKVRGNPDGEITIYRATVGDTFNEGDWVSPSKTYAENHNYAYLDGKGKVIELTVKAKDIRFAGDDLNEFGYFPNGVEEDYSLSSKNEEIAPTGDFNIYGKDVKLQVEEAIAPLQETINNLTEQVQALKDDLVPTAEQVSEQVSEQVQEVKPTQPTLEEVQNLMNIKENKSGSEYARAFYALRDKYGQVELYKSLNEYYSTGTVTQPSNVENIDLAPVSQEVVEKQGQEAFEHITDEQAPSFEDIADEAMWNETFESEPESKVQSPFDERDIDEVGNRKVKAYQYENPEVRPFFQEEAQNMIYDLDNTIKGEKGVAIDELGNYEYYGITRQTTEAIAYLKDNYGYSYDQIRKGLNDIIEDNGKENNAVAKRIEFMLDERLREGYTTSDGIPIPANQEYINFLSERQITEYNKEAFNALTDKDVPLNITPEPQETPTINQNAQTEQTIPMKKITAQNENTDVLEGKQRKWVETSTESKLINREILPDDLDQSKIIYIPISNKDTLAKANTMLSTMGYAKALEYFNNKVYGDTRIRTEDIALGERLLAEAKRLGDKKTEGELIQNVAILGTEMGQNTQILSIVQRMTPEGQLLMLEKIVNRGKVKGDKAFTNVELTDDMRNKILDTYNEDGTYDQDALNQAVEDVKQDIADQMTVTLMDKINAWRYLSMLGNPKTHNRNLVSNVAMKGTLSAKNAVARTIETIAPIENRTKTWKPASQEVKDFAKQTTIEMKDIITGDSKYNETADIKAKRQIFKNKVLNKLSNFNSDLLQKEDWWFSKGAFESSFREFLTANGITTQEDIQNNAELIEKGKQYALEQSQIATFRQYSWLANKIGEMERKNAATQIAVGSIVPFKKTPINIAKTGLSYSPLGFAKTLTYDMAQVKKGNMEASTLIDHIAQNTVGSALTLVGYMLAKAGILNGAGDDDKEGQYDYQLGKQAYSLNIGGNTYSLSWLTPVAMPMMVGANAYEQLEEGQEWNGDVVLETLAQTLDPLSEMSFLSSLDSVLSSYDSGIQKFAGIGESMLQNYLTQFIPTASSQLAATLDDTKRTTKVSGDSSMKIVDETYNKLIYKVPFLRETLEPTTDIWGNEVKQSENLFTRVFENFIAPYSRKESIATEIDEELKDLYSQTGDNGILPSIPYNYVNYDGEKYNMSAEEYTEYKKTYGQTANDLLEDLFRTTTYQRATAEERTEMVNKVYDYARDEAKLEYLEKEGVDYTNATEDGKDVYKENLIKGAIENDMALDEYKMYIEDPEEFSFLKEKGYSYRRKYFKTYESLKEIDESFEDQKEGVNDDDELDVLYSEKKTNIINNIINSGLEDTEKASLYKKYYNTDTVDTIVKSAISIDDYLTYETKEFKADKNAKGNSIPGSRKDKVIDYVNTLDMTIAQKAILIKSTNTFKFNDYNNDIVNYVIDLDLTYEEKKAILEDLDMTIDEEGYVWWD